MEVGSGPEVQPSYYSVLGVSVHSSVEEIRRAYRKLAMVSKHSAEAISIFETS